MPAHSRPPPAAKPKRQRANKLARARRGKYLRVLPALEKSERELELVLESWDDLGDDMRGVRIRWMQPEPAPLPPQPPRVAPLLSVPPLPEGCADEADEACVARRAELPLVIELGDGTGEPPPDLEWADLAGDEEWVLVDEEPTSAAAQMSLF